MGLLNSILWMNTRKGLNIILGPKFEVEERRW
jgi:hypothetical protein